jgi:hypothetical protein
MRKVLVSVVVLAGLVSAAPAAQADTSSVTPKRGCSPPSIEGTTVTSLRFERFGIGFTGGASSGCATARSVASAILFSDLDPCFGSGTAGPFRQRCFVKGYTCVNRGVFDGSEDVAGFVRCARVAGRTKRVITFSYIVVS